MNKKASLVFCAGNAQRSFDLSDAVFRIGRLKENDIAIDNPYISRYHAEIVLEDGVHQLRDLGSTSGTYVNGERIKQKFIRDGDHLRFGRGRGVEFIFRTKEFTAPLGAERKKTDNDLMDIRVMAPEEARFLNAENLPATAELPGSTLEWLRALYEFTSDALTAQTPKDLSDKLSSFLQRALKADRAAVLLYDRERDRLDLVSKRPLSQRAGHSRTIAQRVLKENVAVLSLDARTDERFSEQDSVRLQAIRSVMAAPIGSKTRVWGVCYVDQLTEERAFDEEQLEFLTAVARQAGIILENMCLFDEQRRAMESFIRSLAASIDARDDSTAGHSARVASYSTAIAREMGLDQAECRLIYYAGLLHDYGKIGIRDDVLLKPASLTPEEYEHIKQHPMHTFKILSKIRFPEDLAEIPIVAAAHHERWDGTGYPYGMIGEEIPLGSRIVAVADAYDALVEDRVYSVAVEPERAIEEIRMRSGAYFDPQVVEAFVRFFNQKLKSRKVRKSKQHKRQSRMLNIEVSAPNSMAAGSASD